MEETVHPLFSCFITLYSLILLYFPNDSLQILLSPVFLISGALLVFLLRLGSNTRPGKIHEKTESVNLEEEPKESRVLVRDSETKLDSLIGDFVEWDLRAPLEVIHEDDDDDEDEEEKDPARFREMERFPSLSLCYPESDSGLDSDSSSDFNFPAIGNNWISPEKMGFRWEEDDGIGGEGLIEIKLDEYHRKIIRSKWNQTEFDFHAEEEGLIEIDIFP